MYCQKTKIAFQISPFSPLPYSKLFALFAVVYSLFTTQSDAQTLLYDVNFSSPVHSVGQPPAIDLGPMPRVGPTSLGESVKGGPVDAEAEFVTAEMFGMNQPVEFPGRSNTSFRFQPGWKRHSHSSFIRIVGFD